MLFRDFKALVHIAANKPSLTPAHNAELCQRSVVNEWNLFLSIVEYIVVFYIQCAIRIL